MVGAWPSYIDDDFHTRPGERLQACVHDVLQPFSASLDTAAETSSPMSGGSSDGDGGSGGSSSSSSSSNSSSSNSNNNCSDACFPPREQRGLCSGVVFRGRLGDDRAVRANVPFPFMATMEVHRDGARFKPSEKDLTRGCVLLSAQAVFHPTVRMYYPDEFLARVKADAPFSLLWPGHAATRGNDASRTPEGGVGGRNGGSSGGGAAGADAAGAAASGVNTLDQLTLELERLPSSGPAPFFHAGYTAYFEITLETTAVPPLEREPGPSLECVAIGLAYDRFRLK